MVLRGRAASPVRPGFVIRAVLAGEQPLISPTGEETFVNEACATDIHSLYHELIRRENALRPRAAHLRGMTSGSFAKLMRFARLLGLIEVVREEPMIYPPPRGMLYRVEMEDSTPVVVPGSRKIVRLTDDGRTETRAWGNLCRAWREAWPIPTTEVAPLPEIRIPRKPAVVKPWKPIEFADRPSMRQFHLLLRELRLLKRAAVKGDELNRELRRLSIVVADWQVELDVMVEEAEKADLRKKYVDWYSRLTLVYEALADNELAGATKLVDAMAE